MIDRIERNHSYSMNRIDSPLAEPVEVEEVVQFKRDKRPMPRRRIPGEALVKFGPPGRRQKKPALSQSAAPFELLPRKPKAMKMIAFGLRIMTPESLAGQTIEPAVIKSEEASVVSLSPKKRLHIGQEIRLDGKLAILTWLGETKFEVSMAERKTKLRLKYSDYPDLKRGKCDLKRQKREQKNVAS